MYAVIDAAGYFGNNKTRVYSVHTFVVEAQRAAQSPMYQIISGDDFDVGEIIYGDTIGPIYPRVPKTTLVVMPRSQDRWDPVRRQRARGLEPQRRGLQPLDYLDEN